jgi:DNA-binding transcriptional LysR family regulator
VDELEVRELRYFVALAEELHFGRAADRLGMTQPPLTRAVQRMERRLGVTLLERDRHGVALTQAGQVLLHESRTVLDAAAAATRRTRRAAAANDRLVLVTKAGASHELLQRLLDACRARLGAVLVETLLCEVGEQQEFLRDGRADVAIMHRPVDRLVGLETADLVTEGQVAILPAGHPLAARTSVRLADVAELPDLPMARWPRHDGTYPPGPGPEVRGQAQLAQLVALGQASAVIPASSRAWQWAEHVAVPVSDAPLITTVVAWVPHSRHPRALAELVRTAVDL